MNHSHRGVIVEILLSFFAGLTVSALIALSYPHWPRNRVSRGKDRWVNSYDAGTDVLWRIISARPDAEIELKDGASLRDAVLPFLVMVDRARIGVMPRDALNKNEEAYLALAHSAREMSAPKLRRASRRLPDEDGRLVELSRKLFRMADADFVEHVQSTVRDMRGRSTASDVAQVNAKDAVMAWVEEQESDDDFAAVVGPSEILDVISTAEANPELWHVLVAGLDPKDDRAAPVISWIVNQKECDRATAALALIRSDAVSLMPYADVASCPADLQARWQIARTVCYRSETGGYTRAGLDLAWAHEDNDQSGLLVALATRAMEVEEQGKSAPWPVPETLLAEDFEGSAPNVPYTIVNGALVLSEGRSKGASVIDLTSRIAAA